MEYEGKIEGLEKFNRFLEFYIQMKSLPKNKIKFGFDDEIGFICG